MSEAVQELLHELARVKAVFQLRAIGSVMGMPVFVDPDLPDNVLRFVDPVTGAKNDFVIPDAENAK
jgi:hypothetical protein